MFLCFHFIILILAFSLLLPLHRRDDTRRAIRIIISLSILNFLFYGTFGGFNLGTEIICGGDIEYPRWILKLFCNIDTFYSLIFVFPVCYSFATAIMISTGRRIRSRIQMIKADLRNRLHGLYFRVTAGDRQGQINESRNDSNLQDADIA